MIKDLFLNFSLLIFFLMGFNRLQNFLRQRYQRDFPVFVGIIHGIFGIILIFFGMKIYENNILDLRQLAILTAAYFGGLRATIITGVMLIAFRFSYFGVSNGSIYACVTISISAIVSGYLNRWLKTYWLKWFSMIAFLVLLSCFFFVYQTIEYSNSVFPIMPIYEMSLILGGVFIAIFIHFLNKSDKLKLALKESEESYRTLIETSPDGIFVQIDGIIKLANQKAASLLGAKSPSDLIDLNVFDLIEPIGLTESYDRYYQFMNGDLKQDHKESTYIRLDGLKIDFSFSGSKVIYQGHLATMVSFRDISEQKEAQRKLQHANHLLHKLSITDGLTGLANRRYFDEIFKVKWNEALMNQTPISLILIDIDSFKKFNDTYGHLEGDKCLQMVANIISKNLRRADDFSARYGGEEFIGILSGLSEEESIVIAESIRERIIDLKIPNINSLAIPFVSTSIGLVNLVPNESLHFVDAINFADKALYEAKMNGRNQVNVYSVGTEMSLNR
ncbi:hypothetical protein CN692_19980 [Bacillus sp. AFS002410]|uniref:diguanylate cyclase n=1 Tax=Bacillus sp. AFS002410 TaxID=2033481 RepID=UPI000BF0A850|nr:diguanylate cyclase [Bacillus sp. AFS002410]PEJ54379.1 hypothetical protein CN692_19980 [Bacillus sp. AFS002410]